MLLNGRCDLEPLGISSINLLLPVKPDESDMVELFLREAVIMKDFDHRNVLQIVGVSFEVDGSPMVVLPYMANGDLRQYIMNPDLVSEAHSYSFITLEQVVLFVSPNTIQDGTKNRLLATASQADYYIR